MDPYNQQENIQKIPKMTISLNMQQREVLNFADKWSTDYIKSLGCKIPQNLKPFHIFITGGAGTGKSHLIKPIHMSLIRVLIYIGGNPEKPRILLLDPTGVAATNIDGTTIHSGLITNIVRKLYLSGDRQRAALRNKLSKVKLIIIDEISIISSVLFFQVNPQLNEIFGFSGNENFAEFLVIICGNLYQFPPAKDSPVYSGATSIKGFLALDLR